MRLSEVLDFLSDNNPEHIADLYQKADEFRAEHMGSDVHLRGIVEFSNVCTKLCFYCGIRGGNQLVQRYRMTEDEILEVCGQMAARQQYTVVLQSGEDPFFDREKMGAIITRIKAETPLAVTLSVGVRDKDTLSYWKECGMDRYLLRYETSSNERFLALHPDERLEKRLQCLANLKEVGVQTGSGFLIGLPEQTLEELADELLFATSLDLEMIGVGPFIPHPKTPIGHTKNPFNETIFFKVIALLRLLNPTSHIPATTAFDAIHPNGRNLALQRGANVFMPNATPQKYRINYQIYPGKPCLDESASDCGSCTVHRITALDRTISQSPGHHRRFMQKDTCL